MSLKADVLDYEQQIIERTLKQYLGNRTLAAEALGIARSQLQRKLRVYRVARRRRRAITEQIPALAEVVQQARAQ